MPRASFGPAKLHGFDVVANHLAINLRKPVKPFANWLRATLGSIKLYGERWNHQIAMVSKKIRLGPALRSANPIVVSAFELQSKLPDELKGKLLAAKHLADIVRVKMRQIK